MTFLTKRVMPRPRLVDRNRCCSIWDATLTASPSPIGVCWSSKMVRSPSSGKTTATSNNRR
jgi:hypothetical protein